MDKNLKSDTKKNKALCPFGKRALFYLISLLLDAKDGKIDTDLYACSVYVVSIGALVTLSSIPKIAIESKRIKYGQDIKMEEKTLNENSSQLPHLNEGAS